MKNVSYFLMLICICCVIGIASCDPNNVKPNNNVVYITVTSADSSQDSTPVVVTTPVNPSPELNQWNGCNTSGDVTNLCNRDWKNKQFKTRITEVNVAKRYFTFEVQLCSSIEIWAWYLKIIEDGDCDNPIFVQTVDGSTNPKFKVTDVDFSGDKVYDILIQTEAGWAMNWWYGGTLLFYH